MFSGSVNIDFGSEDMPKEVAQKLEPYRLLRVGGM
jgi:hypothetical protein